MPGRREYENYAVEHEAYAYQLALDMGSAASFTEISRFGFKTLFTWAMGPNFNTKFRLVGPWKWGGANEVMRTELWGVVRQSGGWFCKFLKDCICCFDSDADNLTVFTTYTLIPFILFGTLSAILCVFDAIASLVRGLSRFVYQPFTRSPKVKSI